MLEPGTSQNQSRLWPPSSAAGRGFRLLLIGILASAQRPAPRGVAGMLLAGPNRLLLHSVAASLVLDDSGRFVHSLLSG